VVLLVVAGTWLGQQALDWGATGHGWATGIATEKLPDEAPAFMRDPAMLPDLALIGRELDRAASTWNAEERLDPEPTRRRQIRRSFGWPRNEEGALRGPFAFPSAIRLVHDFMCQPPNGDFAAASAST
jgi:hypothetical protein